MRPRIISDGAKGERKRVRLALTRQRRRLLVYKRCASVYNFNYCFRQAIAFSFSGQYGSDNRASKQIVVFGVHVRGRERVEDESGIEAMECFG